MEYFFIAIVIFIIAFMIWLVVDSMGTLKNSIKAYNHATDLLTRRAEDMLRAECSFRSREEEMASWLDLVHTLDDAEIKKIAVRLKEHDQILKTIKSNMKQLGNV